MPYEPALDGIRALAIIAIAVYHAAPGLVPGGWAGVDVFFVLSGTLITRLLADEMTATGRIAFGCFYARRALRLLPAFALLLAFMLVRAAMAPSFAHATPILQSTGIAAAYLMNWNRAFNWLPQDLLGHTWSLSMEEQFYLLWPVCFLLLRGRRPVAWLCGAVVLVVAWRAYLALTGSDAERTYNGFDTHADALAIGCILALVPLDARLRRLLAVTAPLALLTLAAVLLLMPHRSIATQTLGLTGAALVSAWLVAAAREEGWLKRLLSLRPIAYTGRISYGWYLWHYPFLVLGIWAAPDISTLHRLALVFAAYPVAMASYHFVEKPCLRLRRFFRPTVTAPPATLAPAQ